MSLTGQRSVDRRIQKTERHLHEALSALIREKPYASIAVKEILGRANVARSTFYTHFRDKDELLVHCIHEMIRSGRPAAWSRASRDDVFWFSLPVFAHVDEHRRTGEDRMGAEGRATIHGRLEQVVTELVADGLTGDAGDRDPALPPDLLAHHIAATFVLVLNWWVESGSALTPTEINDRFLALVSPVVGWRKRM